MLSTKDLVKGLGVGLLTMFGSYLAIRLIALTITGGPEPFEAAIGAIFAGMFIVVWTLWKLYNRSPKPRT
jgi:hypothetical protein